MSRPVPVLVAIAEELPVELPHPYVKVITGLGKVNAAIATVQSIIKYKPDYIINFGTCGTLNPEEYGYGLHRVSCVMQRDMDCTPLGFDIGETPFDPEHVVINLGVEGPSLSTGDNFVTSMPTLVSDLVDMEAYAIVKAAKQYDVPVHVYKFITDDANKEASGDWNENVAHGYEVFLENVINA